MKPYSIIKGVLPLLAAAFLFAGCPFSATFPLSEPGTQVPENLIGTWEQNTGSDSGNDKMFLSKTSSTTVDIVKTSAYDGTSTTFKGSFTTINGVIFLNLKEDSEYGSYYFYKLQKEGEFKVRLLEVTPYIRETFETPEALRKYIEQNMNNSYFFTSDEMVFNRIE
jgi:hypothetical protein